MQDYLLVAARVETLFFRMYPMLKRFPRAEQFSLTERIKEAFYDIIKWMSIGSAVPSKRFTSFQEADANIRILKFLLKTAHEQKYITCATYESTGLELTEIAKIVSGLIRNSKNTK